MWIKKITGHVGLLALSVACSIGSVGAAQATAQTAPPVLAAATRQSLELASTSALVIDLSNGRELYASSPDIQVPIASITKLMTAMVMLDANLPMEEEIPVIIRDTKELQGVFSRVKVGSVQTRRELLQLALMSSENRAASALAHNYPGGHAAFVRAMNQKARELGMRRSRFVEPTGLSEYNVSSARDLVLMLLAAYQYPLIRELSTTSNRSVQFRNPVYSQTFGNTNPLVRSADWQIHLSKTGFTDEAGHCLVMLARLAGRPTAVVLLDSFGKQTRVADANRLRRWIETGQSSPIPAAARYYRQQKLQYFKQLQLQRGAG